VKKKAPSRKRAVKGAELGDAAAEDDDLDDVPSDDGVATRRPIKRKSGADGE
jgi:hypothetical protein